MGMKRTSAQAPRPRVVFVDHVARLSGGELALLHLLPSLVADVDVRVILGEDGPLLDRMRSLGIEAEVMALPPRLRDVQRGTVRPGRLDPVAIARTPLYVRRLAKRLRALDADIVHTNSLKASLYGGAAGRLARVPVLWHVRDRIAPDYLPRSAVAVVHAASRVLPSFVVANSAPTLATLPQRDRSRVIYNAVEPPESIERRDLRSDRLTIGLVGRLSPWKGQHVFLDAFAEAFAGTAVRGRLIGSAMFGEDRLRAVAARARRAPRDRRVRSSSAASARTCGRSSPSSTSSSTARSSPSRSARSCSRRWRPACR